MHDLVATRSPLAAGKLTDRFLADIQVSPDTAATYRSALKRFFAWMNKETIERPTVSDLKRFREDLRREMKPLSAGTYTIALRRFFRWLEEEGLYANVALTLKGGRRPKGHLRAALSADDAKRLLAFEATTVRDLRDLALITLMLTTGLREIEVARARASDLVTRNGRPTLMVHGKGRDSRDAFVVLGERASSALRAYFAARGGRKAEEPLFLTHGNRNVRGALTTRSIRRVVTARLVAAGLKAEDVTAHSLRHTAASLAIEGMRRAGGTADILAVKAMLRHTRIDTTMLYSHEADRISNPAELYVEKALG